MHAHPVPHLRSTMASTLLSGNSTLSATSLAATEGVFWDSLTARLLLPLISLSAVSGNRALNS